MALTKSATTLTWASGSATTNGTTNTVDVSGSYAATLYVKIIVVGAPSSAATFVPQFSPDGGTTWFSAFTYQTIAVDGTYYWEIPFPADAQTFKLVYTAQSGGTSSTLTGQVGKVTAV